MSIEHSRTVAQAHIDYSALGCPLPIAQSMEKSVFYRLLSLISVYGQKVNFNGRICGFLYSQIFRVIVVTLFTNNSVHIINFDYG